MGRRPEAAALLAALADPARDFDALIIGSSEQVFYGNQFATMAPLLEHYGVAVWVPVLGGALDPKIAGQEELMNMLGILSKLEIARARIRVRSAMTVQTRDLGGRPPYGYRLIDAGPHPNRVRPPRHAPPTSGHRPAPRPDCVLDLRPAPGPAQCLVPSQVGG